VSGNTGEGGASRSRMDPGSTGVTARLGFIDLAPSSATAKEGTTPRVVVPQQPSWVSTGGRHAVVACGDGHADLRLTGATKSLRTAVPPQPSRALGCWWGGSGGIGAERDDRAAPRWRGYSSSLWQANQKLGSGTMAAQSHGSSGT
jgi:hypothetical protein